MFYQYYEVFLIKTNHAKKISNGKFMKSKKFFLMVFIGAVWLANTVVLLFFGYIIKKSLENYQQIIVSIENVFVQKQ